MDKNLRRVIGERLERCAQALNANGFEARVLPGREALLQAVQEYLPQGGSWSVGGSMTLFETGVIDLLKQGEYTYFDRYAAGADVEDVFQKAKSCDVYLMSSNAVTEDGKLYNVDGRGNRISALIHGPKRVVVVAGYNKVVKDIEAARRRVEEVAAPANGVRLNITDLPAMCSHELVSQKQTVKGRIAVLLLPEAYGY